MLRIYNLIERLGFERWIRGEHYRDGHYVRGGIVVSIDPFMKEWGVSPNLHYFQTSFESGMKPEQLAHARDVAFDAITEAYALANLLAADPNLWEDEADDE